MRRDLALAGATAALLLGATAALGRVFTGDWWGPTFAAVALSLATAVAARRVGFGEVASLVSSAVGFVVFTYVAHLPAGGLLPGPEQWGEFTALFGDGITQFREEPAPAPPLDGLMLIVTTAVWWVTWLSHEILVRGRRAGLAVLPAAVLWAVPLAVPLPPGRTWPQALPFLAGAALVLLLESEVDLAGWATDRAGPRLSRAGIAVGTGALALAAVAPGLLPGYESEPWVDTSRLSDPRGYQPIVDVGDRLHLPDSRDILRVRAPRRVYLRLAGLDTFDGSAWKLGPAGRSSFRPSSDSLYRADGELPPEAPIGRGETVQAQVEVLELENIYVPVPYQPLRITGAARDQMVYSTEGGFVATADLEEFQRAGRTVPGVVEGLEYGVVSTIPSPSPEALRNLTYERDDVTRWLQLPREYPRIRELTQRIYAEVGAETPLDRALALQRYFIGPDSDYTYDVDVPALRGSEALQEFLFEDRVGYCEYYATAMAVMLRATGIPARVSVGFLGGRLTEEGVGSSRTGQSLNTYTVSTDDAHAWVEVLFPGHGWVKFDPTPRSDGQTQPPTGNDLDPQRALFERDEPVEAAPTPTPSASAPGEDDLAADEPESPAAGADDAAAGADGDGGTLWWVLALVGLTALGAGGAGVASRRRHRGADQPGVGEAARVLAAQRRVHAVARRYGVGRHEHETGVETAVRWANEGRVDPETAARFARLCQAAAFGGELPEGSGAQADRLAAVVLEGLAESITVGARVASPLRVPAERVWLTGRDAIRRLRDRDPVS